jgi:hypothetical protein
MTTKFKRRKVFMKNWLVGVSALVSIAGLSTFSPAIAGNEHILPVPLYSQSTNMWCWAASGEMVIKYIDPKAKITQCDEANFNFKKTSCCNNPVPVDCVNGGWQVFHNYGFDFTERDTTALSWDELKTLLNSSKPVMYAWAWHGGGGHMMVATGWATVGGENYVHINNPWPPGTGDQELISYQEWVGGSSYDHNHWADFYNIRKHIVKIPIFKLPQFVAFRRPPVEIQTLKPQIVHPVIQQQSVRALQTVRNLTPINLTRIGFKSASEANSAVLGKPIQEYIVGLDQIKGFSPKQNPEQLLTKTNTVLYPLLINRRVHSAIRIRQIGQEANTVSIGNANLVKMIASLQADDSNLRSQNNETTPAIRVPALGLYFLTRQDGKVLKLTSVFDVPSLGLVKGKYESATDIFARLAQAVAKGNGLPM